MSLQRICQRQRAKFPLLTNVNTSKSCRTNGTIRRHFVSKWTPLAASFNTKQQPKFNLSQDNVGLFGIAQLKDYTGFYLLQESAKIKADELVLEATGENRQRKLVQIFDDLSDCLCQVADMADFIRVAHPDLNYSKAAEEACVSISALVEKLNTNTDIHRVLQDVIKSGDRMPTDSFDHRVAKLFMFDFEQSGIHLADDKRKAFVELNELILMQGSYFMQGCHRPVNANRRDLAQHLQSVFTVNNENISISGLFSDHPNGLIREACYKIYLQHDPRQASLLHSMLQSRDDLANLVGFETYAERALNGTMAMTPECVGDFLDTLADGLRPKADADFAWLDRLKIADSGTGTRLQPWDTAYYSGLARQSQSELSAAEYSAYFSLGSCMEGLSQLFQELYGVTLQPNEPQPGEVWSTDVRKLAVIHETTGTLGHIYCDLFERPGKAHTDCHFTIRGGRQLDSDDEGSYQSPVVVLMLNLPAARGNEPALLAPTAVENLFHEFGHAMHSMLGRTRYQHVTGTRCPTDFAEVPSVLMEYFANDPRVIRRFAQHWRTGERMPDEHIDSLCRVRRMFSASDMQLQLFYAALDQRFHLSHPLDTTQTLKDVQRQYYSLPHIQDTAWHLRFGHFVGYGAKYYSYLMARAVASSIWHQCFAADPFSRTMGQRYHDEVLALGGSRHPTELVQALLNEKVSTQMLVSSLLDDVQM